jgi:hypothetical protein
MKDILKSSFEETLNVFDQDIASIYEKHENTFDLESFHGRFHILRCLFLANTIMEFYIINDISVDSKKVFYSIMFHDIAREDNGFDYWEKHSALKCFDYMVKKGFTRQYAYQTSSLILKRKPFSIEGQILYDVDVLDYYRFFTLPQQHHLFNESKLFFGSLNDISGFLDYYVRRKLMVIAYELAFHSEKISIHKTTNELIDDFTVFYCFNCRI